MHLQKKQLLIFFFLFLLLLVLPGCGTRPASNGRPVEPITPGEDKGEQQALQGRFAVKRADVQILDLSVTADGSLAVVGSASRSIYLSERDGKLRWEKQLNTLPLNTIIDPAGKFIAVGTSGGKVLLLNIDQSLRFEQDFGQPVGILSVSEGGELILAGLLPDNEQDPDKLVALDKLGNIRWEKSFADLLDAKVSGNDNRIFINWLKDDESFIGAFSRDGEKLWEIKDRRLLATDGNARYLLSSNGQEVFFFDNKGRELWSYTTAGIVSRLFMSDTGHYLGVLVTDEATQQEELLYFNSEGELLWSRRLPDDSGLLISPDGRRVIVASWRQYRDDATQVLILNQSGLEVNVLEVAGRSHRLALSGEAGILALGMDDGNVYFLNIHESAAATEMTASERQEQGLQAFYRPVEFSRAKDESLLTLFFYDQNAQFLVPVTRRLKATQSVLKESINELIRGPMQGSQLQRTIPKDADISVSLNEGTVVVDLPPSLDEMAGTTFLSGILDSLVLTVSQFPTVERIGFTVGGEERSTFGQEGIVINGSHPPQRYTRFPGERLVYLPYQSGGRYYLLPLAVDILPLKDFALAEALIMHIMSASSDFFPPGAALQDVHIEGNTITLDFNRAFKELIRKNDAETAARAAMVRDAIILSVVENLPASTVRLAVNGQLLQPPNFLPWELTVSKPYYINLED